MANWHLAGDVVRDILRAGWTATPALLANGEGLDGMPFIAPVGAPWLFAEILWGDGDGAADGAWVRRRGRLWLTVFAPSGTGRGGAERLAGQAAALFENRDINGVVFADSLPGGRAEAAHAGVKGAWWGEAVSIGFYLDEHRS